jgi:site-specific recombinase XerD
MGCYSASPEHPLGIQQNIQDFMAFAGLRQPRQCRDIPWVHVMAWRDQLITQELASDTIWRQLAALSFVYAYPCACHAVLHYLVLGVKRLRPMNGEGVTPALGDHHDRTLRQAPPADTLQGTRDRVMRATLVAHSGRSEARCKWTVGDLQRREDVPHLCVEWG